MFQTQVLAVHAHCCAHPGTQIQNHSAVPRMPTASMQTDQFPAIFPRFGDLPPSNISQQGHEFLPSQLEPKQSLELAGVKGGCWRGLGRQSHRRALPQHKPVPSSCWRSSHSSDFAHTMANQSGAGAWPGLRRLQGGQCAVCWGQDVFMERAGNTGWLLIAAQRGRRVFFADACACPIGSCVPGDLLSDKAELYTGTPSE